MCASSKVRFSAVAVENNQYCSGRAAHARSLYHVLMIWFACKLCGNKQSRSDEQAGSLVFCTCGQANRVPWESDPAAQEAPQAFPKVWVDESSPRPHEAR